MSAVATKQVERELVAPATQEEAAELIVRAAAEDQALYLQGGGTGASLGLAARRAGWNLATTGLARIVDYPWQDMTITVEAGITIEALSAELAKQGQRLPIDVPQAARATLGGVMAANTSGPRRYAQGTMRDYVIGVTAIDGRGVAFKAGGRVVKNVAGYDFCKLLTGSRGTLGLITQVTLKLRPLQPATAFVICDVSDVDSAEPLLAALVQTSAAPTAIELLAGPAWNANPLLGNGIAAEGTRLLVGLEGTDQEVAWMCEQIARELQTAGASNAQSIVGDAADQLWNQLREFPVADDTGLVVEATVLASQVTRFIRVARGLDKTCSVQAHAGDGVVNVRFLDFSAGDALPLLIRGLHPAAIHGGGHATVVGVPAGVELTPQAVWGPAPAGLAMMRAVKSQFDPHGLFNPGLSIFAC